GLDLVRAQLLVASGEPLPWAQDRIGQRGHAIEARIYAEDPASGHLPQAGPLHVYREPHWPGVRIDSGVAEGGQVSIHYDPMIANVIASAETGEQATARLIEALRQFRIEGVRTNRPFVVRVLGTDAFRQGSIDTAYLDREGEAIVNSIEQPINNQAAISNQPPISNQSAISNQQSAISSKGYDPWNGVAVAAAARTPTTARRKSSRGSAGPTLVAPMPATVIKIHVKPG